MENGFLNLLKPTGMTSFDVIRFLRRQLPFGKFGHSGTLDLAASGVLVIACGAATKILPFLSSEKCYVFSVIFGLETETGDLWGRIMKHKEMKVSRSQIENLLPQMIGQIELPVPLFSAKHWHGQRMYQWAIQNQTLNYQPKQAIQVYELTLLDLNSGPPTTARLRMRCSHGTYVRAMAQRIGSLLQGYACAGFLIRTQSGSFALNQSQPLSEIALGLAKWIDVKEALTHLPCVVLPDRWLRNFVNGQPVTWPETRANLVSVTDRGGQFLGMGRIYESLLKAERLYR
ncbi:MAG: tRNA pseudouridine(55) synthase TruB [bacterium]